ncbi:hypothetical protein DRJ17_01425 [Candidatus Woesearchaeota archaeon]|nr:MAG: hypothetical protein DRJ17_01425 [Candidatus Woesearchaeota archaeon]
MIGAGDIKYHYFNLLKVKEEEFKKEIEAIAKIIVNSGYEIVLLPDRGISFEIAKRYKKLGRGRVIGTVPLSDKDFGIDHLKSYMESKIKRKKVFDEFIDTENWYKQDLTHCIFGDVIFMLGNSLGSLGELVYGYYLYKLFIGDKPEVQAKRKAIHPEARAGEDIPYSVIVYKPFVKEKLNYEIEEYIRKLNGKIYYVKNSEELKAVLEKLKTLAHN